MDFEAIVHLVLPLVTGQSARGEWKKQEVIFELPGEFNRKLCVAFWNDRADSAGALRVGEKVAVSANVQSQERNGRWYTEVRGWRFSRVGEFSAQQQGGQTQYGGGYSSQPQGQGDNYGGGGSNYGGGNGGGYSQQPQSTTQTSAQSVAQESPADDLPF